MVFDYKCDTGADLLLATVPVSCNFIVSMQLRSDMSASNGNRVVKTTEERRAYVGTSSRRTSTED